MAEAGGVTPDSGEEEAGGAPALGSGAPASPIEHPSDLEEARSWIDFKLDEMGGRSVGRIEDVLVDAESGAPAWLLLRTGRLRGRAAVPFELAAPGIGHVWVRTRGRRSARLHRCPPTASTRPPSSHSAITTGFRRAAEGGRRSRAARARP